MKIGYAIGRHIITEITKHEYDVLSNLLNGKAVPTMEMLAERYIKQCFKNSLININHTTCVFSTKFNEACETEYLARYLVMALDHRPKYFKIV